jgi:hypothetical protein
VQQIEETSAFQLLPLSKERDLSSRSGFSEFMMAEEQ